MRKGFSDWIIEAWDKLLASDPGLTRLRMAGSAVTGVASALLVEYVFALVTHAGKMGTIISMLLGAIICMMGTMALAGRDFLPKLKIAAFFPVALGTGLLIGVLVSSHTVIMLTMFVVVMFIAIFIRRFGMPFFFYGFMGWMGYFFATFTHATWSQLPGLLIAIIIASAWVLFLSGVLLRTNPKKNLQRTLNAFESRARTMIRSCSDLLSATEPNRRKRLKRRLHTRQVQLSEAALMIEGWSAEDGSLPPERSAPLLRRRVIDVQHVLDRMAGSAEMLIDLDPSIAQTAARIADRLVYRDDTNIKDDVQDLIKRSKDTYSKLNSKQGLKDPDTFRLAVRSFAEAALEFTSLIQEMTIDQDDEKLRDRSIDEYNPVVGLFLGNLPGSPAVAQDVPARGQGWNPLARLSLVNRQAVQALIAGALAIIIGREVSPVRYYWAVIATFVMFAGTATRSETFQKGLNRVIGTLIGLFASIWFAQLTSGHITLVIAVILMSIFCGFYLFRISYAYMIFFITIMIGQLYSVLHMFSPGMLILRLEETIVGALIGFVVTLIVVPLSTRDTIRTARNTLFSVLGELLNADADEMDQKESDQDLDELTLNLDNHMRQLSVVAKPLTSKLVLGYSPRVRHRLSLYGSITSGARALSVALRNSEAKEPLTNEDLALACRSLSEIAKELSEGPTKSLTTKTKERFVAIEKWLFDNPALSPSDIAESPIHRRLLHLHRLLEEFCDQPSDPL